MITGHAYTTHPLNLLKPNINSIGVIRYTKGLKIFIKPPDTKQNRSRSNGPKQIFLSHNRLMAALDAINKAEKGNGTLEDKKCRAALNLANLPCVEPYSDRFFSLHENKLFDFMEAYQDIDYTYDQLTRGLPAEEQTPPDLAPNTAPKKTSKIVKAAAIGLTLLLGGVSLYYGVNWILDNYDPLVNDLRADFKSDPQVDVDPQEMAEKAAATYRNAHLDYNSMSKVARNLVNNCTFANLKYELPLDSNALANLSVAAERNADIGDFTPAYVTDFEGNVHSIQSNNIARDSWMIYENLFRDKDVLSRPDWYLAVNMLAQQNGYDFCERYGLDPDSPDAWDVINKLRDHLFDDSRLGYKIALPQLADPNDKKICYMSLFGMPERVADLDDYKSNPRDPMQYTGLRAAKYTVDNLQRLYNEVTSEYPDGRTHDMPTSVLNNRDYRLSYYSWISDRAGHGLEESARSLLGDVNAGNNGHIDILWEKVNNTENVDSDIGDIWSDYDLIKFVKGYGVTYFGVESEGEGLYSPIAFRAFGVPTMPSWYEHNCGIYPTAIGKDIGFLGVPDDVVQAMKEKVPGYIDYPGNGLHLLAISVDGLNEDIEYGKTHTDEYSAAFFETKLCPRGKDIYTLRVGESERNSRTYG